MNIWNKVRNNPRLGLVALAYIAFIALGMPDGLLGVGWPSIRASFSIPIDALGMLLATSVTGYMTSSFLSGPLMSRLGVGRLLAISCALTFIGLVGYTLAPAWWVMVLLGVITGLGAGAIDAGLNTYVAANFGEGMMQWLHACYGIGITFGPVIMTLALTTRYSWRLGYQVVGGFQILLALCFTATLAMWSKEHKHSETEEPKRLTDYKTPMRETLRQPAVWLSVTLFFLYVGVEMTLGNWTYSLLTESRGLDPVLAGLLAGSFWAMFTIGRIVAGLFAKRVGINFLVLGGVTGAIIGALLLLWNPFSAASILAILILGLSIAPIFPALMSGTSKRVGEHYAANTIGMQMAATGLGAVLIPSLTGIFARRYSLEVIPICLLVTFAGLLTVYLITNNLAKQKKYSLTTE